MSRRIDRDSKTETCRDVAGRQISSTLEQIVDRYIFEHRDRARRELQYYAMQHTFEDAIKLAALSKLPNGKKHPHQHRISGHTLGTAKEVLLSISGELRECRKFEDLIEKVDSEIRRPIKGIGKLAVYDIALRIGAYLELTPERVYIPSKKTQAGARAIGLNGGHNFLSVDEFPEPFYSLTPREIEDCLCIYRDELSRITSN